jgi:glutaredoxin
MADKLTVYWQPGCTSCLRVREFLRERGIGFESVNVREDPLAMARLAELGVRTVPVVARGSSFVLAQDLDEVARFVGVTIERDRLPVEVLAARIPRLLDCAAAITRRFPDAALGTPLPGRKRTNLDLAYHVPQIVVALLDAVAGGCLTYEHFNRKPPVWLATAEGAATSTERVARAFGQWWLANAGALPLTVDTYYGVQAFDAALERTAWHVAQHVRQLERVLQTLDLATRTTLLPAELLDGLPLPQDVWDAEVPLG